MQEESSGDPSAKVAVYIIGQHWACKGVKGEKGIERVGLPIKYSYPEIVDGVITFIVWQMLVIVTVKDFVCVIDPEVPII